MRNSERTGSWISTICQGRPGPQVAGRAVHDAQQRRQVVRQLGAGAEAGVVDVREVILEVDPGADGEDGLEDAASGSAWSASSWVGS